MYAAIDDALDGLQSRGIRAQGPLTLVGIAGTFTTLAAMEKQLVALFPRRSPRQPLDA